MSGALANTTAQGILDASLVTNKTNIASNFTFALNTTVRANAFAGDAAAATVRTMLNSVTASTDAAAFQSTIDTVIANLVASHPVAADDPGNDWVMLIGMAPPDHGMWLA